MDRDEKREEINKRRKELKELENQYFINKSQKSQKLDNLTEKLIKVSFDEDYPKIYSVTKQLQDLVVGLKKFDDTDEVEEIKNSKFEFIDLPQFIDSDVGIVRGTLVTLGAQSGVGKTTIGCNWALDYAKNKKRVLFYSTEMSRHQIWIKLYCIHMKKVHNERYSVKAVSKFVGSDLDSFVEFVKEKREWIKVVNSEYYTAEDICGSYEYYAQNKFIDLVITDYIQIQDVEKTMINTSIREQMMHKSRIYKAKSKDSGTIFLNLSQLNKEDQFRESQAINDDSAMSIIATRKKFDDTGEMSESIEFKITKNRFGPLQMTHGHIDGTTGAVISANPPTGAMR